MTLTRTVKPVGLVLVSHSGNLAKGAAEVAAQMAPDVTILPAGGTDDDRIGTSFDRVAEMIGRVQAEGSAVLVMADLGSALMTAEAVVEFTDGEVEVADVPFVEGAVAAAVAAQSGADLAAVHAAARTAIAAFTAPPPAPAARPTSTNPSSSNPTSRNQPNAGTPDPSPQAQDIGPGTNAGDPLTRTLILQNALGLHARPAALVARIVAEHDATVTINDVDATSVLALMGLALPGGAKVTLSASGPNAETVMDALVTELEAGFGED